MEERLELFQNAFLAPETLDNFVGVFASNGLLVVNSALFSGGADTICLVQNKSELPERVLLVG